MARVRAATASIGARGAIVDGEQRDAGEHAGIIIFIQQHWDIALGNAILPNFNGDRFQAGASG